MLFLFVQLEKHERELSEWEARKNAECRKQAEEALLLLKTNTVKPTKRRSFTKFGRHRTRSHSHSATSRTGRRSRTPRVLFSSCSSNPRSPQRNSQVSKDSGDTDRAFGNDITDVVAAGNSKDTNTDSNTMGDENSSISKTNRPPLSSAVSAKVKPPLPPQQAAATCVTTAAVLKITIHLDGENVAGFDEAHYRQAIAQATGVTPAQVGLKLARGRVVRRKINSRPELNENSSAAGNSANTMQRQVKPGKVLDEEGDAFYDVQEERR